MRNVLFMRGWKPTMKMFKDRMKIDRKVAYKLLFKEIQIKCSTTQEIADKYFDKFHVIIENYLTSKGYFDILFSHLNPKSQGINKSAKIAPIWVCWWQGESKMPPIVKVCYDRICKFAGEHPVHLVTVDNFNNYVYFDENVTRKFYNKELLPAHMADLLRLKLLDQYGGLWLDSTIYLSGPLDDKIFDYDFYSLKNDCTNHISVSNFRWCSFVIGGLKGNALIHALAVAFEKYIVTEECFIHYLVIDYFIDMLYRKSSYVQEVIDDLPEGGKYLHTLRLLYAQPFNKKYFEEMLADTSYFKLTYKENLILNTQKGEETFYSVILKNK